MENVKDFLRTIPLFKSFSPWELLKLIEKSQIKTFEAGECIIAFGESGKFLGLVIDGEVEVSAVTESGERKILTLLKQGDMFGEMSLLTGEPTCADVIAFNKCKVFLIPQETFSTSLAINPSAMMFMAKTLSDRLRNRQDDEEAQQRLKDAWRLSQDPYGLKLSPSMPSKILVINCGSSSLKYSYYDTANENNYIEGLVERIGLDNSRNIIHRKTVKTTVELGSADYAKAFQSVIDVLTNPAEGVIKELKEITAVGHRVVHGGDKYSNPVIINEEVIKDVDAFSKLAPLHNPPNLLAIKESLRLMPEVPQVAVFDTAFHQKMLPQAYLYALPYKFYEQDHIRRYGFHGISHNYSTLQAAAFLKRDFHELKIITCHLGNGASICAIDHGRSADTSMGFTPLEGLVMGTRCGDLDPFIPLFLSKEKNLTAEEIDTLLNRKSGLLGISELSSDMRELEQAANQGDQKAALAIQIFCYRIRKYIGAYVASLGGIDVLVFTGGIGEGSAWVRALACQGLSYMGIQLDEMLNKTSKPSAREVTDISAPGSHIKILIIPADEGRMIARETIRTLGYQNVAQVIESQKEKTIPIEVSAHHVHLARKEINTLFGDNHQLTRKADLSQTGQFACEETVNLIGPKGRVEKVRVLGPERKQSQVEISMTEEFKLGIKAPIRASGDLHGSPAIILEGPKGTAEIPEGVICSLRHIHMNPEDALSFGLKDKDIVMVRIEGDRTLIFGDILVRIDPDFRLSMHIDTDEANAANIRTGMNGNLIGMEDRR